MTAIGSGLCDADLHGLVDGKLDANRRIDVLRRLAKAPKDRARVEAWQDQNDLLRATFGSVEREPLPITLDCSPTPRLRCVSSEPGLIFAAPEADIKPRQHWFGATALVTLIALAGVIWYHQAPDSRDGSLPDVQLRGSVDDASRARSVAAPGTASKAHESLPTVVIPDLTMAGFTFVSAETQPSRPASLSFHYLNAASETLVITVARATAAPMLPSAASSVSPWHSHDNTFALSGSVAPERLRVIASSLQANDPQ